MRTLNSNFENWITTNLKYIKMKKLFCMNYHSQQEEKNLITTTSFQRIQIYIILDSDFASMTDVPAVNRVDLLYR